MGRERKIIIVMVIIILILLAVLIVPRVTYTFQAKYFTQGYNECVADTINKMVSDLGTYGYTQIYAGNQTINLGIIQVSQG